MGRTSEISIRSARSTISRDIFPPPEEIQSVKSIPPVFLHQLLAFPFVPRPMLQNDIALGMPAPPSHWNRRKVNTMGRPIPPMVLFVELLNVIAPSHTFAHHVMPMLPGNPIF